MRRPQRPSRPARHGFTLLELLVVVLIVTLLSAATLPAILPALNSRRVSEGSRILQSEFARARDAAVRSNSPRGFRLLPDPNFDGFPAGSTDPLTGTTVPAGGLPSRKLTASRIVSLEVPPDYSEGKLYLGHGVDPTAMAPGTGTPPGYTNQPGYPYGPLPYQQGPSAGFTTARVVDTYLRVVEQKVDTVSGISLPANPTNWYWNLRQGDKLRLSDSGRYYTVVGPLVVNGAENPERFINMGYPNGAYPTGPGTTNAEFLFLLNGEDDDGDGFIDEAFDGIDNDGDGIVDPGFNGIDDDLVNGIDDVAEMYLHRLADGTFTYPGYKSPLTGPSPEKADQNYQNEFEAERFVGKVSPEPSYGPPAVFPSALGYTVQRRPVPTSSSREVSLPTNVVIDLTGSFSVLGERSRVPIDPKTGFVDILVAPNGQILASAAGTNLAPPVEYPFYHFWFSERDDVYEPTAYAGFPFTLPMLPQSGGDPRIGTASYPAEAPTLKGERRLLSVNTRTGQITSTSIETFYVNNTSYPFEAAEAGVKDAQP